LVRFARNEKQPGLRFGAAMLRWLKRIFGSSSPDNSGARGEEHAADWLRRKRGFVLVARNWRDPRDRRREIDLVCRDGEVLVFVEVKARAAGALVPGYFAVDRRKKRIMRRAIDAYLSQLTKPPRTFRFDVVEIAHSTAPDQVPEVLHFENIQIFPKHYRG
jgi:putative endonuclease